MDLHYQTVTAEDNAALQQLLVRVLSTVPIPHTRESGALDMLNLACGNCRETEPLVTGIRAMMPSLVGPARMVGVDIRGSQLEEARRRAASLQIHNLHTEFLEADCSRLVCHRSLGDAFQFVFLRHQNFWNEPAMWTRIFAEGLHRLGEGGLLVITSYFDREHCMALRAVARAGGELLTTMRNPLSRPLPGRGKSVDRHLAVFRRASATKR